MWKIISINMTSTLSDIVRFLANISKYTIICNCVCSTKEIVCISSLITMGRASARSGLNYPNVVHLSLTLI